MRFNLRWLMAMIAALAMFFGGIAWAMKSDFVQSVYWKGSQGVELSIYFYPWLTWAAVGGILIALVAFITDKRTWRVRSLGFLLPFLVPIAILCFGVAFRNQGPDGSLAGRGTLFLDAIFWLHVPIGIGLLACFRSKSNWLIIIGLTIVAVWLSYGSYFMSWMSVTNIWL